MLVRDAEVLVTMDAARRGIAGGGLFSRDGVIEAFGLAETMPAECAEDAGRLGPVAWHAHCVRLDAAGIVHGRVLVQRGRPTAPDLPALVERRDRLARRIAG